MTDPVLVFAFIAQLTTSSGEHIKQEYTYDTLLKCKTDQVLFQITAVNRDLPHQVIACYEK